MKFLTLFILSSFLVNAQSNVDDLLTLALKKGMAGLAPLPEKDKSIVLSKTSELLIKHVTFRPDGTVSSVSTATGRRLNLEWKNLVVKLITADAVSDADQLNGITKRYRAILSSDASRKWDEKMNAWTAWSPTPHLLFPSSITVELKNGAWLASGSTYTNKFIPGPGPSITDAPPAPKDKVLPPGMSRQ